MATYKQIQEAHELRMWIKEVGIPAVTAVVLLASNDDVRHCASDLCKNGYQKVEDFVNKITKKEGKSKRSDIVDCDFYVVR